MANPTLSGVTDLTPTMAVVEGQEAIAQAVVRRLLASRGSQIDDPSYAGALRVWIGACEPIPAERIAGACKTLALLDERVTECAASGSYDSATSTLTIVLHVVSVDDGSFELTTSVDTLTGEIFWENVPE